MNTDKLTDAMTGLDPAMLREAAPVNISYTEAEAPPPASAPKTDFIPAPEQSRRSAKAKKRRRFTFPAITAAILAAVLLVTSPFGGNKAAAQELAAAVYPDYAPYPGDVPRGESNSDAYKKWEKAYSAWKFSRKNNRKYLGAAQNLADFFSESAAVFLADNKGTNALYSPFNLYQALAMTAEITDGSAKEDILKLLHANSAEALREQAAALLTSGYVNDGAFKSVPAASLWLSDSLKYNQDTIDRLASDYWASSFYGTVGEPAYDTLLQNWVNEQTGGLLKEEAEALKMDVLTVLKLVVTHELKVKWDQPFSAEANENGIFHGAAGDTDAVFMKETNEYGTAFWGEHFTAAEKKLCEGVFARMRFILPDEGYTPEDILGDADLAEFLFGHMGEVGYTWPDNRMLKLHLSVPKFDVRSSLEMSEGLKALGLESLFELSKSTYAPLTEDSPVMLSAVNSSARVMIDEEGVSAASFIAMVYAGAPIPPEEELYFTLDRPFLFVVYGIDDIPLYIGIVNQV